MSLLRSVRNDIQKIAETIATVLEIEVTVYDNELVVVASTGGGMHSRIGSRVRGHVIKEVMKKKKTIVNDQPGKNELCKSCILQGNCPEQADISSPIILDGTAIGVISLTAYSQKQRNSLLKRQKALQSFLEKISELIRSTLAEYELIQKLSTLVEQLETLIYCVHEGVLAIDNKGKIIHLNRSAEELLHLNGSKVKGKSVEKVISGLPLREVLKNDKGYTDRELFLKVAGKRINTMSTARPVKKSGEIIGAVVTFRDMRDVNRFVYEMSSHQEHIYLDDICTCNPTMLKLKEKAQLISHSDSTVLIQGESGTGKELFARAIHSESHRKDGPFITINCAAIPDNLLESELFGYEGGAFTGAHKKGKPGKFELANGGTIFLDEIGDMSLHLQAKLLRVLEERKVDRVGGIKPIPIDVRVIAATNRNLEEMVSTGEFRQDLYFRLNVIPIFIPPLRERQEDIPLLVKFFLDKYKSILRKDHIKGITSQALDVLKQYTWPGNVRELENAIEYAINIETETNIHLSSLPPKILKASFYNEKNKKSEDRESIIPLAEMERRMIIKALKRFGNSLEGKKRAAKTLGIDLSTLYRKLKKIKENGFSPKQLIKN